VCADGETVATLCDRFIAAVRAYTSGGKARDEGDERLMRAVEDRMPIPDPRRDEFRREMTNFVDALAVQGKAFGAGTNARLRQALERTVAEDGKN
jgi:serine protein kinase